MARATLRRAERRVVSLQRTGHLPGEWALAYLNRLADRLPWVAEAVEEMLAQTSTTYAPWSIIAGNNKYHARLEVLAAVSRAIHAATGK